LGEGVDIEIVEALGPLLLVLQRVPLEEAAALQGEVSHQHLIHPLGDELRDGHRVGFERPELVAFFLVTSRHRSVDFLLDFV